MLLMEVVMKYEVPVCELIKLTNEDIISTSDTGCEGGEVGDTPIGPIYPNNTDNG